MKIKKILFIVLFAFSSFVFANENFVACNNFINQADKNDELLSLQVSSPLFERQNDELILKLNYEINFNYELYEKNIAKLEDKFKTLQKQEINFQNYEELKNILYKMDENLSAFVFVKEKENSLSANIYFSKDKFPKSTKEQKLSLNEFALFYLLKNDKKTLDSNYLCFSQNIDFLTSYLDFDNKDFIIIYPYFKLASQNENCKFNKITLSQDNKSIKGNIHINLKDKKIKNLKDDDFDFSLLLKNIKQNDLKMFSDFI